MNALTQYELGILQWIEQLHSPALDIVMLLITKLGEYGLPSILLAVVLLCKKSTRKVGAALLSALALVGLFCNLLLKPLVARIRPYDLLENPDLLVAPLHDFSFPSGHTTVCFATAMVLSHYYPRQKWIFIVVASLVGLSRLYLQVHYPTDVLAGGLLGVASARLGIYLFERFFTRSIQPKS